MCVLFIDEKSLLPYLTFLHAPLTMKYFVETRNYGNLPFVMS